MHCFCSKTQRYTVIPAGLPHVALDGQVLNVKLLYAQRAKQALPKAGNLRMAIAG